MADDHCNPVESLATPNPHAPSEVSQEDIQAQNTSITSNTESYDTIQQDNQSQTHARIPYYSFLGEGPPVVVAQANSCYSEPSNVDNFLRGCKWAPDGSCLLVCSNDNKLRIFDFPAQLLSCHTAEPRPVEEEMLPALTVREGEPIYDFVWYPQTRSVDPVTCCFASVCREHPIHLWDAFTGVLRATYTPYNHLDEVCAPYCLAFNGSGSRLYGGFTNCIRVFDVSRPGRQVETRNFYKKKTVCLQGMVSSMAFNPAFQDIYAVGTYSQSIGIFSEADNCASLLCQITNLVGGVTHLAFSHDGNYLFSGGRKDPEIKCWDLRNPIGEVFSLTRKVKTNQRMYFDVNRNGYVFSGNSDGTISIWNTDSLLKDLDQGQPTEHSEAPNMALTSYSYQAHLDCVNSMSVHPSLPILASGSGQRHFPLPRMCTDVGSDSEVSSDEELCIHMDATSVNFENSLKLWYFPQTQQSDKTS